MPPPQCPECGRFLKQALVDSLTADPTPCPRCETGLVAGMFVGERSVRPPDLGPLLAPASPAPTVVEGPPLAPPLPGSVRPPDLVPVMVRDEPRDVLAGWDAGEDPADLDRWRDDRAPFPTDTVVVAAAGAVGALIGAWLLDRRVRSAALGGLVGVLGAGAVRQVWRLDP